jgi:Nuclear pore protein 84 / 107
MILLVSLFRVCTERAGLDIHAITKRITSLAVHAPDGTALPTSSSSSLDQKVSAEDEQKIQAVEWLCFDPAQRVDALLQSNSLARVLLADAKVEAVRKLLVDVLPTDTIPLVRQCWTTEQYVSFLSNSHTRDLSNSRTLICPVVSSCFFC